VYKRQAAKLFSVVSWSWSCTQHRLPSQAQEAHGPAEHSV